MNLKLFSKKLTSLQKAHKISLRTLASEIGVSNTLLNYYVRMERNPSDKIIEKLANYFNVPKSYFENEIDFDPYVMLDYVNNNADIFIKDEMNDILLDDTMRSMIFSSLSNSQKLPPLIDNPMRRLQFLYLTLMYEEKLKQEFLSNTQEDVFPSLLTDYSYNDIQRLFSLLGNISRYGLKAMLQHGESILENESSIIENKKLATQVQNKIVDAIEDNIKFSLHLDEYSDDSNSDDKVNINMFSACEDISDILKDSLDIHLTNESKKKLQEDLTCIIQKEIDNDNLIK